jgi:hypothetical protein
MESLRFAILRNAVAVAFVLVLVARTLTLCQRVIAEQFDVQQTVEKLSFSIHDVRPFIFHVGVIFDWISAHALLTVNNSHRQRISMIWISMSRNGVFMHPSQVHQVKKMRFTWHAVSQFQ